MAHLTERANVIRATRWKIEDGPSGCSIYVARESAGTEQAVGYALPKINAAPEVFADFEHGAGVYDLELAADLSGSRPRVTCIAAKFVEPLTITANGSQNGK